VKEFSCLPFLDNSSPEAERLNSYPAWHLQVLISFEYDCNNWGSGSLQSYV
jgi:hypothetical protein